MNVLAAKFSTYFKSIILLAAVASFFASCTVVRDFPDKPFVYKTDIDIEGKLTTDQRKDLTSKLREQLHDSLTVPRIEKVFISVIKNPPAFDSLNAEKSLSFMRALLHAQGYYRDSLNYTVGIKKVGDQYRTTINFQVRPGKLFQIDSIRINMNDSGQKAAFPHYSASLDTLQRITLEAQGGSLLKKGEPFAKPLISAELDRLSDVYRNNGFLRFSREELLVLWDTVGIALLRPTFDPIEQALLFEALQRRRENPAADIEVRLRSNADSSHLIRYHVGDITLFPEYSPDSAASSGNTQIYKGIRIISYKNLFNPRVLAENIYLRRGQLYDQRTHLRTLNRFNALTSWRLANVDAVPRPNSDTVDFVIRLSPAPKYLFDINLEGSYNLGGLYTGSNLLGLNFNLQNRNFARAANQSNTAVGIATEINAGSLYQTIQVSAGQSIYFPRLIPKSLPVPKAWKENAKTSLALSARYVHRIEYLDLLSLNGSWGYDFNWKKNLLLIRYPNIEATFLDKHKLLDSLISQNQSYKYIFNAGLVISDLPVIGLTKTGGRKNVTNLFRANFETSGIIAGLFRNKFLDSNLRRYVRIDASFQQNVKIRRSAFAWRFFGGLGNSLPYPTVNGVADSFRLYMPFYKAYFAGGANSMRGWALRRLGPGSAVKSFARTGEGVAPERFGDIQLEGNAEYRFYIANFRGVLINSALFTDIGNIWYLRKNNDFPDGEFRFDKLWKDLAIAVGTGIRLDFTFIKFRLDYAFKAKDPSPADPAAQNKWFYKFNPLKGAVQVGVAYPF